MDKHPLADHDGKVIGSTGIGEDITDKRQAEEALRESEEKYRTILENIADGYHETDLKGHPTLVNDSLCRIMGYSREELVGLSYSRLMDEQNAKLIFSAYNEVYRTGKANPGVGFQIIRKDGEKRDIVVSVALIRDKEGNGCGFRGIFRDVTDQTRLQRQLLHAQKMEAVGTLAGGIAHDFNNLLQSILGYSDLLLMKKPPGDPDRKKLEVIQHAARDGADLVSRILMFSRKAQSKMRPIDLNDEIRRVEKLLRRTLPRMIQIDLALSKDLKIIDADPAQIEQILLNLAANAQHAMLDGGRFVIETNNVSLKR